MAKDRIEIGRYSFDTDTTITQPKANGDYHLTLDFGVVSLENTAIIKRLYEQPKELEFKSEYAAHQGYFIDYIVMTDINASSVGPESAHVIVKCVSDSPFDLNID